MTYATYRLSVVAAESARNATGMCAALPYSAGSVKIAPATATARAAFTGAWLALTFDHSRCPGTARSRENAYMTRLPAVSAEPPQKNWPTTLMIITALNSDTDNDDAKTAIDEPAPYGFPWPPFMYSTCVAAKVNASS